MRTRMGAIAAGLVLTLLVGCATATRSLESRPVLVDPAATAETRALFINLKRLASEALLFGHQNTLAYGFDWAGEPGRSDVREVAGAYPSVYGWDANMLFPNRAGLTQADRLRGWIAEGYERGGVITMSWHLNNPVTGAVFYDTTRAVEHILPGGSHHEVYRAKLDTLATFFTTLRGSRGELIPVVFRPFHEMSGSWFWWGANHATPEEYRQLWRFTVEYLRDRKGVHNLLWAFSPDVFDSQAEFLERYPGDGYVDVLGYDDYHSVKTVETRGEFVRRLRDVVELAEARGKIAALTETGVETIPDPTWWTETLLPALRDDPVARRIAWVLVWRNANAATDRPNHYYAPYPGHASAPDFRRFREDPLMLFGDDLPDLYQQPAIRSRP